MPSATIVEKAIRSLYDWRATLVFLAKLTLVSEGPERATVSLKLKSTPDYFIIDWFNARLTRGKKPNLAHDMLAHLARPLRFRTILTTNFDTLLEESFLDLNQKLHVFPISQKSGLPDYRTVRSQNSLIKLHGELSDTRADFSIDATPTDEDLDTFQRYVNPSKLGHHPVENHIIVSGFSGRDLRIINFIRRVLAEYPTLKLFWICYSDSDVERVCNIFEPYITTQLVVAKTPRIDLLLYELYQKCTLSLPAGGFSVTFAHKVPPVRERPSIDDQVHKLWAKQIQIGKALKVKPYMAEVDEMGHNVHAVLAHSRALGYYSLEGVHIVDHANHLVGHLEKLGMNCIWLEMADFASPDAMLHELMSTIAAKRGFFHLQHAEFVPKSISEPSEERISRRLARLKALVKILGIMPERWVILIYGRTVPGASAGWHSSPWGKTEYEKFYQTIKMLGYDLGFKIVYMPLTVHRYAIQTELNKRILEQIAGERVDVSSGWSVAWTTALARIASKLQSCSDEFMEFHSISCGPDVIKENIDSVFESNIKENKSKKAPICLPYLYEDWLYPNSTTKEKHSPFGGKEDVVERRTRLQFLYGLLLFRQSRHPNRPLKNGSF